MRTYRIYIPLVLLILSAVFISKTSFSESILLDVKYNQLTKETQKQIDCLADNIYHEAGHESDEGKKAVALVTLNRTQDPRFPKDICGVVKQKTLNTCQFSWFCEPIRKTEPDLYQKSKEIAIFVYANYEKLSDITKGALYYHADYINPKWKLEKTTVIGRHIFYKESGKYYDAKTELTTEGRTIKTFLFTSDGGYISQ
jgi:spore germination cell wall hydrolase CwlJ-like protein